jgi:hypothetical protein
MEQLRFYKLIEIVSENPEIIDIYCKPSEIASFTKKHSEATGKEFYAALVIGETQVKHESEWLSIEN